MPNFRRIDSSCPSLQGTSGGATQLHGQEREIEQHRGEDSADESLRDRREDDADVVDGQRKGAGLRRDDRIENDLVDLDRGRENDDGLQIGRHSGHVR